MKTKLPILALMVLSGCTTAATGISTTVTADGTPTTTTAQTTTSATAPAEASMTVTYELKGRTITVEVEPVGFVIEYDRLDTSGRTGHVHLFIDSDPPAPGENVPLGQDDIIHSTTNVLTATLAAGEHFLWVVAADGDDNALVPPEPVRIDVTVGTR